MKKLFVLILTSLFIGCSFNSEPARSTEEHAELVLENFLEELEMDVISLHAIQDVQRQIGYVEQFQKLEHVQTSSEMKDLVSFTEENYLFEASENPDLTFEDYLDDMENVATKKNLEVVERNSSKIVIDQGYRMYDVLFRYELVSKNDNNQRYNGNALFTVRVIYEHKSHRFYTAIVKDVEFES
ncbi:MULTISPECIES: hypothetical protein [Bacillaceae]|uniref:Lipoprotein n=1 Tax=Alkalicoccobacillus plakortidis TaxID=444060 RepID=A0A9D5DT08_9BACI|nr:MULTISPECIES: hypothetical protein [Bacillaceae]KQL58692.1 hypothetical protein AN965_01585 [Alkalicoccobacillus plakortidis]